MDVLGLAAVVGGMVAVGVLGDRDDREDRAARDPTTTSGPRRIPYSSTSSTATVPTTVPRAYTVTSRFEGPTGTALLVIRTTAAEVIDVDSGRVTPVTAADGSQPFPVRGGFVLAGARLDLLLASGERQPVRALEDTWPVGTTSETVWLRSGARIFEQTLGGEETGRGVAVPWDAYASHVADGGVVIGQAGSLTFLPFDGSPRSLGAGVPLATGGDVLAKVACELLRCRLELVDLRDGGTRVITGIPAVASEIGHAPMSPDGRWLVVQPATLDATWYLVEVRTARANPIPGIWGAGPLALAPSGDVLFSISFGELRIHDLDSGAAYDVKGFDATGVQSIHAAEVGPR